MKRHIRLTALSVFILSAGYTSAQSVRKLMEMPDRIIESKWEYDSQGNTELNYYNSDVCDYYLSIENDRAYNLRTGKNTIFRIDKASKADQPATRLNRYRFFRGQFPQDFQISTPYALPTKNGRDISWQVDPQESLKTMIFRVPEGDTIYATRRGVACTTVLPKQLLIYHPDHTFAAYLMMAKNFLQPGEIILTGQPIGIAGAAGVAISYFFLDENKFKVGAAIGYPYSHFTPTFRTNKGDIKLEENTTYQAVVNDELMMQEMSKREKKKYLKEKY